MSSDDGSSEFDVDDESAEHPDESTSYDVADGYPGVAADDGDSPGYDTGYDPTADPHAPGLGGDATQVRYRRLPGELTSARTVTDLVMTVRRYGWLPPFLALLVHGVARGVFEFASDPVAISQGFVFQGWPFALAINLLYGVFLGGFVWFLYFGVIGAFAGFFSDEKVMETDIFKAGAYLLLTFVPLLAVSAAVAFTIPPSVATVGGEGAPAVIDVHRAVAATIQMRVAGVVLSAGWILVGFLLLPMVSELYDVGTKASVVSVLPVTLIAVVATQLV